VSDPYRSGQALDSAFDQLEIGILLELHAVQPLGFSLGYVTRSWPAGGIRILMVPDQRAPVLVTGSFD